MEPQLSEASLPWDIPAVRPGRDLPDHMLPALLKPAEKRALDLLSDWPWISRKDLAGLMDVSEPRVSQLVTPLEGFGLAARLSAAGRRLALTDGGLAVLARRDRASVGVARRRWSVTPEDPEAPLSWRNVSGAGSRQLLRNVEHTTAVHGFIAALARQSRSLGWKLVQIDPPRRASRYFRHGGLPARAGGLRSVHPDAFGILRRGRTTWPFFLEWERRAVRPATMAERLAPYLRYYSSRRPLDDHGAQPAVLVVEDDEDGDPLPAGGKGGDGQDPGPSPPVGLPQGDSRRPGASGTGLAHSRRLGARPRPPGALNIRRGTGVERRLSPRPERRFYKAMGLDRNDESAGPRRRRGRAVVRLDTVALWNRLALLGRSQNWLAGKAGISPGYLSMLVNEGRAPSGRIRRRIQEALGIEDFHQLFTLEDRDENP